MVFPAPIKSPPYGIESQWIDYNGHFNMAYYNVLFDRDSDVALALVGLGPAYVKQTGNSYFSLGIPCQLFARTTSARPWFG